MVTCTPATNGCVKEAVVAGGQDGKHWCALNMSKLTSPLDDDQITQDAIGFLKEAAALRKGPEKRPFFVGVGLHKPHMPFYFPAENLNLYPLGTVRPPKHNLPPTGMPMAAWHEGNFNNSWGKPCPNSETYRRAYYSAVSYTDSNIGKVLAALDDTGLADETAVAFMGDHGWQLGELNLWRKMTNFELGVRVPLMLRAPWIPESRGVKQPALAEAVDLYQTLAELAGIPATKSTLPPDQVLQGSSLVPLLRAPANQSLHKPYAFSQFAKSMEYSRELKKPEPWNECTKCAHKDIVVMGYSVREDRWRYTEWVHWNNATSLPEWSQSAGVELYDHDGDYGTDMDAASPTENVASNPKYESVVKRLSAVIRQQFDNDHLKPDVSE